MSEADGGMILLIRNYIGAIGANEGVVSNELIQAVYAAADVVEESERMMQTIVDLLDMMCAGSISLTDYSIGESSERESQVFDHLCAETGSVRAHALEKLQGKNRRRMASTSIVKMRLGQ
jgi:hypothetical protein